MLWFDMDTCGTHVCSLRPTICLPAPAKLFEGRQRSVESHSEVKIYSISKIMKHNDPRPAPRSHCHIRYNNQMRFIKRVNDTIRDFVIDSSFALR